MVCTRDDDKCDDESREKYECVHDHGHSTAINPDFGTVRLHNDHLLVRGLGPCSGPNPCSDNALAAPPPESTLPPILLPSAVVPSVALSGPDLFARLRGG